MDKEEIDLLEDILNEEICSCIENGFTKDLFTLLGIMQKFNIKNHYEDSVKKYLEKYKESKI